MSRARALEVTSRASREIERASRWWDENRPAAPDAFREDVRRAFSLLVFQPEIGAVAANVRLSGVRRLLLHRTGYHLYYRVNADSVEVLALWHASRGRGPALGHPR